MKSEPWSSKNDDTAGILEYIHHCGQETTKLKPPTPNPRSGERSSNPGQVIPKTPNGTYTTAFSFYILY